MTYNEAKPKVLNHLEVLGWKTDKFLKVPTAQKNVSGFTVTFFFKSQSIYFSATQDGTKDFNDYERKAWDKLDSLCRVHLGKGELKVFHGEDLDNGMTRIALLPKQKQLVLRA